MLESVLPARRHGWAMFPADMARSSIAFVTLLLALQACGGPHASTTSPPTAPPSGSATSAGSAAASGGKEDIAPEASTGYVTRDAVIGKRHMVAAANPHASRAGQAMLRAGGSAVDAAVAMAVTLSLVEPQSSGIGGGAFMLRFDGKTKRIVAYDGRETAPEAATEDMFLGKDGKRRDFFDAVVGGLSVGVPGELRMLELAHQKHGKLPWKKLFEPAIRLAEDGFAISPRLFSLLEGDRFLATSPGAGAYFYGPDHKPKPVGTVLRNQALADVFRAVADAGANAFYEGPVAADIVRAVQKAWRNPGRLKLSDMKAYRPVVREAVCGNYRDYAVCGMPPPSSGGTTVLSILGMLERFDLAALPSGGADEAHLFLEASRLAYADRDRYVADPDVVQVPTSAMVAPSYLRERSKAIDATRAASSKVPPGDVAAKSASRWADDRSGDLPSTSHMVAADGDGNVITMTASIEGAFGSHVWVRGMLLNNELTDFSFVPRAAGKPVANRVGPGKRPRSSMAPTFVLRDDAMVLAVGSPGGSRIIEYVARVLVAVVDHGEDPQRAIDRPNISNRNGVTELEAFEADPTWLKATKAALETKGHRIEVRDLNSGLQAIQRTRGGWVGAADPRREGLVLAD
jgi:gamma-glutamyltranspeptidase / glutathione hydrolase